MKMWMRVLPLVALLPVAARAGKIPLGAGDATLNVGVLLQPQVQMIDKGSPDGSLDTQFFLRRLRLSAYGNVMKDVGYFFQLDSPRFGRNGVYDFAFVQDAYLNYQFVDGVFVEGGLLLLPFSHQADQGGASALGLDVRNDLTLYPAYGATASARTLDKGLRSVGAQLRGTVLDKKLGFRLGVYEGVRGVTGVTGGTPAAPTAPANPSGVPMVGGRVHYSLLGSEAGTTYGGIYFSDSAILSVGFGAQFQPKAIAAGAGAASTTADYVALAADVFAELPFGGDTELVFQTDGYRYDYGAGNPRTGYGILGEAGYRIGKFQPVVYADFFRGSDVHSNDRRALAGGLVYWINKHVFNVKAEFQNLRTESAAGPRVNTNQFTLQTQVNF